METDDNSTIDEPDLVRLLVLEAGRLMEEASPMLAMRLPEDQAARSAFIASAQQSAQAIDAMLLAAATLSRLDRSDDIVFRSGS